MFRNVYFFSHVQKVVSEVRSVYGKKKWTKAIIRSKCLFTENVLFFAGFFFLTYFAKNTYSSKLTEKRLGRTTVNKKSIRERVLLFSNFSMNLTDSPFYYKLPFNILFYYFMEIKTSKISGHSWHRRRNNREIKIHVYAKRQTWICTTWPSFPLIFRLLFIASTQKWVVLYPF